MFWAPTLVLGRPEASETFAAAVRVQNRSDDCTIGTRRMEHLAGLLANDLKSTSKHYHGLGYLGIFSPVYASAKVSVVFEQVCRRAQAHNVAQLCEVGFNAGESAMLFLEAAPAARLVSFELGDQSKPWVRRAGQRLDRVYGDRFRLHLGDSKVTIPEHVSRRPDEMCDVAFIDGSKTFEGRLTDIRNMRRASRKGALLFLDEVTSQGCITGEVDAARCSRSRNGGYDQAMRAYRNATASGLIRIVSCVVPRRDDGLCVAEFV